MTELLDFFKDRMRLPCGGVAYFDEMSGISYRCETCMAVVGSIGQPQHCKDEAEKWSMWEALGGQGWDYFKELEEYDTMDTEHIVR